MNLEKTKTPAEKELPGNARGANAATLRSQRLKSKGVSSHTDARENVRLEVPTMSRSIWDVADLGSRTSARPSPQRRRHRRGNEESAFEVSDTFQRRPKAVMLKAFTVACMLWTAVLYPILVDLRTLWFIDIFLFEVLSIAFMLQHGDEIVTYGPFTIALVNFLGLAGLAVYLSKAVSLEDLDHVAPWILVANSLLLLCTVYLFPALEQSWRDFISLDEDIEAPHVVERISLSNDTCWNMEVDINWKCVCGLSFREEVLEYRPGAAKELARSLEANTTIDIEQIAGSELEADFNPSSKDISSNFLHRRLSQREEKVNTSIQNPSKVQDTPGLTNKEFILLCRENGKDTKLHHADISNARCDYTSYHVLHEEYYGRFNKIWKWVRLSEIASIEFVKFHLYWKTNINIDSKDFGALPPESSEDYSFHADTNPPVPKKALRHFFEHPHHAPKIPHHRPRLPKKVREPLVLDKLSTEREGYGLYVCECVSWTRVVIMEVVITIVCLSFAVLWCIEKNGGIQDGCAVAGLGLACGNIILGAFQAVA